jgi:glycosyltransferase involved in cell wall biosynthesis
MSLRVQTLRAELFEVLIVDDGAELHSAPATRCLVQELSLWFAVPLRYLPVVGKHGSAAAKNVGWRAARGEIIAFTHDDGIADPDWLKTGLASFGPGVIAVSGRVTRAAQGLPQDPNGHLPLEAMNCFCRKTALESIGGFDERFKMPSPDEADLYFSLLELSARSKSHFELIHSPEALVFYPGRGSSWGRNIKSAKSAFFNPLLYKKHPDLYRKTLQHPPAWQPLAATAALLIAALAALGKVDGIATLALIAWALTTFALFRKKLRGTRRSPSQWILLLLASILTPPLETYWRIRGGIEFR